LAPRKGSSARRLARIGIIAGAYSALTILFGPWSYGPVQVRPSEALTVLPFFAPDAVIGLTLGCFIANVLGPVGLPDVIFGTAATGIAAWLTARSKSVHLAPLPPVIVNAMIVSAYLSAWAGLPYWATAAYVGLGETVGTGACWREIPTTSSREWP
jgi:uncharacterized membrane protein